MTCVCPCASARAARQDSKGVIRKACEMQTLLIKSLHVEKYRDNLGPQSAAYMNSNPSGFICIIKQGITSRLTQDEWTSRSSGKAHLYS